MKQQEELRIYNEKNDLFIKKYEQYEVEYVKELDNEHDNFISMKDRIITDEIEYTKFALIEEKNRYELITKEQIKKTPIDIMFSYLTKIKQPNYFDVSFFDNPIIRQQLIEKMTQLLQSKNNTVIASSKVENWDTTSNVTDNTFDLINEIFHPISPVTS